MNISKYKISDRDLDQLVNYLVANLAFDYKNHSSDMTVLAKEEFYFRNKSKQMNMIIAKLRDSSVLVDVMGSAGGTGLLNINLWSEKGYLKRVKKVLEKYIQEYNLEMEELAV